MKNLLLLFFVCCSYLLVAQNKIPSKESQIATAIIAAPDMYKEEAKVIGYNSDGELVTLREGNNGLICLADDPNVEGISVACYSDKLEPFMARGRELTAEGRAKEKQDIRKKEIDDGTIIMPEEPAIVYVVSADESDYDIQTGTLNDYHIRYVFYKPYMTVEETGLPDKPAGPGAPWLMDAGTHRSHIMITPPRK